MAIPSPAIPCMAAAGGGGIRFHITAPFRRDIANAMARLHVLEVLASHEMLPIHMTHDQFRGFVDDEVRRAARIIAMLRVAR
jgi:hypothetical protein